MACVVRIMRIDITCTCPAYGFPHRLSGGKCDGTVWVEDYLWTVGLECHTCPQRNDNGCDVAEGRESLELCAGLLDCMDRG